jgi:hypothetical protein
MIGVAICPERQKLLDAYGEATREFILRGRELAATALSYETDLFQRAWDRCEDARRRCADVRHQLVTHMEDHSCLLDLFGAAEAEGQKTHGAGG